MPDDQAEDMRRKAKEVELVAREVEAEALSEDGSVRILVGGAGNIKELDLRMNAFKLSGVELGEVIVETLDGASKKVQAELSQQVSAIMGREVSPDDFSGAPAKIERETEDYR